MYVSASSGSAKCGAIDGGYVRINRGEAAKMRGDQAHMDLYQRERELGSFLCTRAFPQHGLRFVVASAVGMYALGRGNNIMYRGQCGTIAGGVQLAAAGRGGSRRLASGRVLPPHQGQHSGAANSLLMLIHRDGHSGGAGGRLWAPGGGVAKAAPRHHLVQLGQVRFEVHVHGRGRQDRRGLRGRAGGGKWGQEAGLVGQEGSGGRKLGGWAGGGKRPLFAV